MFIDRASGKASDLQAMDNAAIVFNNITESLAAEFASKKNPGFTVVAQPGLTGINLMKFPDPLVYLSDLDCFHPSQCSNEAFTYQIWNNMMSPPGKKSTEPDFNNLKVICPTEDTFLQ